MICKIRQNLLISKIHLCGRSLACQGPGVLTCYCVKPTHMDCNKWMFICKHYLGIGQVWATRLSAAQRVDKSGSMIYIKGVTSKSMLYGFYLSKIMGQSILVNATFLYLPSSTAELREWHWVRQKAFWWLSVSSWDKSAAMIIWLLFAGDRKGIQLVCNNHDE